MTEVFKWIRQGYEFVKFEWSVQVPSSLHITGQTFSSPFFSPQETPNSKWKLQLIGMTKEIGIYVKQFNSTGEYVKFLEPLVVKMLILDRQGRKVFHQTALFTPNSPLGVKFLVSKESLIKSEGQQADESYTFCCNIFNKVELLSFSPADPSVNVIDCSGGLSNHLEGLFNSMQFSDVNFNIGGRDFPAHKNILSARSDVFAAMFQHPTKENLTNQIEIEDIEPDVFQELLRFIYTGRVQVDKLEVMAAYLLIAADKYLLDQLKLTCQNHMLNHMTPENCVALLVNGDLKNPTELLKDAAKFFRCLPSQVMATERWEKIEEENPRLLCQIYKFLLITK